MTGESEGRRLDLPGHAGNGNQYVLQEDYVPQEDREPL